VLFKTYADKFYARKRPPDNPKSYDKEWLLKGDVDKPVYFVSKNTQLQKYRDRYQLPVLKEEYGFVYYFRDVVTDTSNTLKAIK
jgi:hypothetical protein